MFLILMFMIIILIVCVMEFSKLRKQNDKVIEQNYLIITLLDEIKKQRRNY